MATIPEPQVTTKAVYRYNLDLAGEPILEPILYQEGLETTSTHYPYLIVRIDITIETDNEVEGGFYVDHDAFGYMATKTGERDQRSKLTRVWASIDTYAKYEADARKRFNGGVR